MQKMPSKNQDNKDVDSEILDFNNPLYSFVPPGMHDWRQQGFYLVCKSCELQHAVFIGPDKLLAGMNKDGAPILRKRDV